MSREWEEPVGAESEAVSALPATDCGGESSNVTEMAEGELDVDSLISRLLEGEFVIT